MVEKALGRVGCLEEVHLTVDDVRAELEVMRTAGVARNVIAFVRELRNGVLSTIPCIGELSVVVADQRDAAQQRAAIAVRVA